MPWSDLYFYWLSKHKGERPPARTDLDPLLEIPSLVRNTMLIARERDGYRNRLIGSEIARRVGRDDTGKPIDAKIFGPTTLTAWLELMDHVTERQSPRLALVRVAPSNALSMLTIMLPLVSANGQTEGIFSGCFFDAVPSRSRQVVPLEPVEVLVPYDESVEQMPDAARLII